MFLPNQLCSASINQGETIVPVTIEYALTIPAGFYAVRKPDGNLLLCHRQQLTPMNQVPSRFKRHQFERFSTVIGEALRAFPEAIVVDPTPLAVDTYSARCRDAVTAKQKYKYLSPDIDEKLFADHAEDLVFSMHENYVLIGSRDAVKQRRLAAVGSITQALKAANTSKAEVTLDATFIEQFCKLLHHRAFSPALTNITVVGLTPEQVESLETRYDVAFAPIAGVEGKYQVI